jgi:hypothetical protein
MNVLDEMFHKWHAMEMNEFKTTQIKKERRATERRENNIE